MSEAAGIIQVEVSKMMGDVERLDKRVSNLVNHFNSAQNDLEAIQRVTRNQANVKPFSQWIADGRSLGNHEMDRMKNISLGLIDSVVTRSPAIYYRDSMGFYQLVTSTHFLRSLRASDEFLE